MTSSTAAPRYFYWIAYGAVPFLLLCTYLGATAHFGETRPVAPSVTATPCVAPNVAPGSGMRINPCAELDTTQVVDSRTRPGVRYLVRLGDFPLASTDKMNLIRDCVPTRGSKCAWFWIPAEVAEAEWHRPAAELPQHELPGDRLETVACTDDNAELCAALVEAGYRGDPDDGSESLRVTHDDLEAARATLRTK